MHSKKLMTQLTLCACLLFGLAPFVAGAGDNAGKQEAKKLSQSEALKLQQRLFDGMIAHDLNGLSKILTPDLVYIHIGGATQHSSKEFLDWVDTGPKFETFKLMDPKVLIYSDAMALTGRVESISKTITKAADGSEEVKHNVLNLVLSCVWERQADGWKMALLQYTQIPNSK